ncbi:hypothetical protein PsYK624_080250 [Phanerochaete sordida]|uniref:Uncharacterized protein n=1 Tax=Phanerochaete sordida TaxID=48140 RepID=A0A9P3GCJ5_9APHY|nr:hypothetical protein PsYK624_080250 [Phanerochaete sordida]
MATRKQLKTREREAAKDTPVEAAREESPEGSNTASSERSVDQELQTGVVLDSDRRARASRGITLDTRDYFTPRLVERLNSLCYYVNPETTCYSLRTLPIIDLAWGQTGTGRSDASEYLCKDDKPVTLWIVGEIVAPNFAKDGVPRRKAGVLIRPLLEEDFRKAVAVMNSYSLPKSDDLTLHDGVWVTRWMGSRAVPDDEVPVFTEIYDATSMVRAKKFMTRKRHTEISARDLAVAEATIVRWPVTDKEKVDQKSSGRPSRRSWESWRVEFRLESLWFIYQGSQHDVGARGPGEDVMI